MKLDIYQKSGKKSAKKISLNEAVFGITPNDHCVYLAISSEMASIRQGTHSSKTKGEVAGSGAKPWRQKGTGRARAGTSRGPIWRKGGVTFAASPRSFEQKVNKKMYRAAMQSILSELVRQERLVIAEEFTMDSHKTKDFVAKMEELQLSNVLIIAEDLDEKLYLASRNVPHVAVTEAGSVDPVSLVAFNKVLVTVSALKKLEENLG